MLSNSQGSLVGSLIAKLLHEAVNGFMYHDMLSLSFTPLICLSGKIQHFRQPTKLFQYSSLSVLTASATWHTILLPIPAVISENVVDKSYLVCGENKKYAFLVTLRPLHMVHEARGK